MDDTKIVPQYTIDFALMIIAGNITRYRIIRPLIERDVEVRSRWYPIRTWYEGDPLRILPGTLRLRLRHFLDSWKLFIRPPADATIIHAFETYYLYVAMQKLLRSKTIIINNPDATDPRNSRTLFAVQRTDLFILWSNWAIQRFKRDFPEVSDSKIVLIHPGI